MRIAEGRLNKALYRLSTSAPERKHDAWLNHRSRSEDLKTQFFTQDGVVKAVNGVSFTLNEGETLGLVGESGCGKSVSALSLMRLIPQPPGKIVAGEIIFDGRRPAQARRRRDAQDPRQRDRHDLPGPDDVAEPGADHRPPDQRGARAAPRHGPDAARKRTIELLELVGIPAAATRVDDYPHQFSGGMRQRVMIAMALSCKPEAAARRRADDGARRDDPGPDPRPDQAPAPGARHGGHHDHPRPRRRRRHVPTASTSCTPGISSRRAPRSEIFRQSAPPLHAGSAEVDPAAGRGTQGESWCRSRACRPTWSMRRRAARSSRAALPSPVQRAEHAASYVRWRQASDRLLGRRRTSQPDRGTAVTKSVTGAVFAERQAASGVSDGTAPVMADVSASA